MLFFKMASSHKISSMTWHNNGFSIYHTIFKQSLYCRINLNIGY